VPTRIPVLFLTRVAAVPGGLALRANFEVLWLAQNLTPFVAAKLTPLPSLCTDTSNGLWPPFRNLYHAGQDIGGNVVPLHKLSRRRDTHGIPHMPNLTGVGVISVHAKGESRACVVVAILCGLAQPLQRPPLAPRDAAP
jgi:hypothetical protein